MPTPLTLGIYVNNQLKTVSANWERLRSQTFTFDSYYRSYNLSLTLRGIGVSMTMSMAVGN